MKGYSLLTGITIIKITQGLLFQLTKQHQKHHLEQAVKAEGLSS